MSAEPILRVAGRPVAALHDLPALERRLVHALRLWVSGRSGQRRVAEGGALGLDARRGRACLLRLDETMSLVLLHGRRETAIAPDGSEGVFADEAVLARLVALAAEGARDEAVLMAALLVRADLSLALARAAEGLGLALMRAADARAGDA